MISKELFVKFIRNYQVFDQAIERLELAISGRKYGCNLFESDWAEAVGMMLDKFLESHFTEEGCDLVIWWMFEDVDKIIYEPNKQLSFFEENEDKAISVETIDELWNYITSNSKEYLLDG